MRQLFSPISINSLRLNNRLVRSATWEGMCDPDGCPTEKLESLYKDLAAGGVGLIITGYTFVSPEGKQLPGKMGIADNTCLDAMRHMTRSVHDAGGTIAVQLVHAGGQTDTRHAGRTPLAPSAITSPQFPETPQELTITEIDRLVDAFAAAADRAQQAGFDAVQIHGAHGYLISQFLSPATNKRNDSYGGSLANRSRFLLRVYQAIRETVGADYPVCVKLNGDDFLEQGFSTDEAVEVARILDSEGIDAIEVSGGTPASGACSPVRKKINAPTKEAYHRHCAARIKQAVSCPVMCVGGFRSLEVINDVLGKKEADMVSLARPLIREPHLPNRWKSGDHSPARCISCNGCFVPGIKEGGIYCVVEKKEQEKNG